MMVLKILHGDGVLCSHWQFDKATVETILADFFQINIQLAEPDLDRHFPEGGGADVDFGGVLNQFSGFAGQSGVITERPEQNVRVEQKPHA
ncbi:hypothetical protein D3C78_1816200 [compost metagenome]